MYLLDIPSLPLMVLFIILQASEIWVVLMLRLYLVLLCHIRCAVPFVLALNVTVYLFLCKHVSIIVNNVYILWTKI